MDDMLVDEADYEAALQQGAVERSLAPLPLSVRYDAGSRRFILEFDNGAAFLIPAARLQNLADAKREDLEQVELAGETGLHWPNLDVDFTIADLLQGVFGTAAFMSAARKGGQSRSLAKMEAARRNGQRGGRPRKSS
ncbi:DUF2442 domain-containing protein [Devosia rhizoryzae]|uniref:DUF2442 domain-containing protein n=1 Tax=Devosia rhizoryzae TaxID=2774137 RepID=A0ABX7C0Z3_9HYPH|nr:DUF2442 domain-containing protein [Devosia rhizoryzae]QQR37909.1 DUF2442 domain-containing protein [Devosia rhizoryzae]